RPGDALTAAFAEQVGALPEGPRIAVALAAASADGRLATIVPALRALGRRPDDLEVAEAAGVVALDAETVTFRHPLLRGAVLRAAPSGVLRRAHLALAETLDPRRDPERWVWHRAEAADGPDAAVADALADVARGAGARAGYATAARNLARAAGLTPDAPTRGARRVAAAEAALAAGRAGWAAELVRASRADLAAPGLRARADLALGHAMITGGDLGEMVAEMSAAALRTEDPAARAEMLALASFAAVLQDHPPQGLALARRALAAASDAAQGVAALQGWASYAVAAVLAGEGRAVHARLPVVRAVADACADAPEAAAVLATLGLALSWLEEGDDAARLVQRSLDGLRRRGLTGALVVPLTSAAQVALRAGRWTEAAECVDEAIVLGRESGQAVAVTFALAASARVHAGCGHQERCETDAGRALAMSWTCGASAAAVHVAYARALLAAGAGRHDEVHAHLLPFAERPWGYGVGDALVLPWRSELIEAEVALGRRDEARERLRQLALVAHRTASPTALAILERCRGLVEGPAGERHLRQALVHHARGGVPFETARTLLLLGAHLRRVRRRAEARPHLERARTADYVTFTASSTARNWRRAIGAEGAPAARIVSIGPVTSATLRELGMPVHAEADEHTIPGLVRALVRDAAPG
ncbi:MAG TPA: uroporphyrinogen-III synthase, partial [Miltoncostaeaceae bacterium]|nr:uroporphyrinogen-III synthase [Miltoncostaeaceae bacterium]